MELLQALHLFHPPFESRYLIGDFLGPQVGGAARGKEGRQNKKDGDGKSNAKRTGWHATDLYGA
jgi:hypothetical protein